MQGIIIQDCVSQQNLNFNENVSEKINIINIR